MAAKWLRAGSFAALDQAWLSGLNFAISIAFMRWATKTDYGVYLLLLTPIYLAQGVQGALFISPFATLFPKRAPEQQAPVLQLLVWGQVFFTIAAAVLGFIGLAVYHLAQGQALDPMLALAFALAIMGALAREAMRSAQYVRGHADAALLGDIIYGVPLLAVLACGIWAERLSAVWILCGSGLAGLLPLLKHAFSKERMALALPRHELAEFWRCGRWALTGVGLTWLNLNIYTYIAAAAFGVGAVGEINAARLFMMPMVLCLPAWSNLVRPKFSAWYAQQQWARMRSATLQSLLGGGVLLASYIGVLSLCYPMLESLLGNGYHGLFHLVLAWSLFFFITMMRTILMATLMVDEAGYKRLSQISVLALLVLVPAMAVAVYLNTTAIVLGLALIELFQTLLIARVAFTFWQGASPR